MNNLDFYLPLDPTGQATSNKILKERHELGTEPTRLILPEWIAFFSNSLRVYQIDYETGQERDCAVGVQYFTSEMLHKSSYKTGKEIQCAILVIDQTVSGTVYLDYQALGGEDLPSRTRLLQILSDLAGMSKTDWNTLNKPKEFQPTKHLQDAADLYGAEYIVDALSRLRQAISIGDAAVHDQILFQELPRLEEPFYHVYDKDLLEKIDLIEFNSESAQQENTRINSALLEIKANRERVLKIALEALNNSAEYELRNKNTVLALAAMKLTVENYWRNNILIAAPELIDHVYLWCDFTDKARFSAVNSLNYLLSDKSPYQRTFRSTTVTVENNPVLGTQVCRFRGPAELIQSNGSIMTIEAPMTLFVVSARVDNKAEKVDLLRGAQRAIGIDIDAGYVLESGVVGQTLYDFRAGSRNDDVLAAHITVAGFGEGFKRDFVLTNSAETTSAYRGHHGFREKPDLQAFIADKIGGLDVDQCADVAEILVFDRQLSLYEVDAVLEYFKIKYNLSVNLIANGDFASGLSEFETDYRLSIDSANKGEISAIHKEPYNNLSGALSSFYIFPGFVEALRRSQARDRFLAVRPGRLSNLSFWRQKHHLQRHVQYCLEFDLCYNPLNPPVLTVKINGVALTNSFVLSASEFTAKDLTYYFTPEVDEVEIALYSSGSEGLDNLFALDNLRLRRKFFI